MIGIFPMNPNDLMQNLGISHQTDLNRLYDIPRFKNGFINVLEKMAHFTF